MELTEELITEALVMEELIATDELDLLDDAADELKAADEEIALDEIIDAAIDEATEDDATEEEETLAADEAVITLNPHCASVFQALLS